VLHSNTWGAVVFSSPAIRSVIFQSHVFIFRRPVTCPYISSSSSSFICLGCYRVIKLHGGMSLAVDRFIGPSPTGHWQIRCRVLCIYLPVSSTRQRRKVAAVEEISKFHSASSRNSVSRSATGTVPRRTCQDFTVKDVRQRSIIVVELFNFLRLCSVQLCGQRLIGWNIPCRCQVCCGLPEALGILC